MKNALHDKLLAMVEALIAGKDDEAAELYHDYSVRKTQSLVLGEKEEEEEKDDDKDDDDKDDDDEDKGDDDKDDDDDDKDDDKKSKKSKKEKMDEMDTSHDKDVKNRDHGDVYKKVPHKDNSRGYGYEKTKKAARKLKDAPGGKESGKDAKKGDAYKDVPHKDNSRGYGYEKTKKAARAGLKGVEKTVNSPDTKGGENRRTDKAK